MSDGPCQPTAVIRPGSVPFRFPPHSYPGLFCSASVASHRSYGSYHSITGLAHGQHYGPIRPIHISNHTRVASRAARAKQNPKNPHPGERNLSRQRPWSETLATAISRREEEKREIGSDSEAEKKERKKVVALAPIAKPLAGKKLSKRTLKLVRKAAEHKCLKRGVKEVVKSIRRGSKGLCVIAGNISPIDVITHVPILCEEAEIPYIYVTSKEDLASAGVTKRPTCCVLVLTKPTKGEIGQEEQEKLKSEYNQVVADVSKMASSLL